MPTHLNVDFGVIKIICRPCRKCDRVEEVIAKAIHELQIKFKVKYHYQLVRSSDLSEAKRYSANISQTPFIIVDNQLVLAGRINDVAAAKSIFYDLIKNRGTHF